MTLRLAPVLLAAAIASPFGARAAAIEAAALPPATRRIAASAEECAVWQREASFARSVEAHDEAAFASHVHPGAVFDAGVPEFSRGGSAIVASWRALLDGSALALRWRPGIVHIGGDLDVALSKGPYILQLPGATGGDFRVGLYQTVWVRKGEGPWLALFDGSASTPLTMASRAAADAWVSAQPMSACDAP